MILSFQTEMPGQTVQTQIRLLLEESDLGLHCLPFRLHRLDSSSRKHLHMKVAPDLHLTYTGSKKQGNLGLVLKMINIACFSILLIKHVKYFYFNLFKLVSYNILTVIMKSKS